jgi:imidazolonepropionase-like amidohydrolase
MRFMLLLPILVFAAPLRADEPAVVIRNATVETLAAAGRLDRATVLIRNGKIAAVGKDVAVPEDAKVIDAHGGTVMPGLVDPHFEVSIASATADAGPRTIVVRGQVITLPAGGGRSAGGYTRIADNFYPYDAGYKPLPRVGLTRLNLVTGGTGQAAVVRATPNEPEQMLDRADGIAFVSVSNSTDSLDQVRSRLEAAARAKTGGGSGGAPGRPTGQTPMAGAQLWADVLDGKTPLLAAVANPAAVLHLLKALEPYKNVQLTVFATGATLAETVDALKARKVRVILRPGLELVTNTRDRFAPARLLHEAGIEFGFSLTAKPPSAADLPAAAGAQPTTAGPDDNPAAQDFPLFPVAVLVKAGLPRQAALEALAKRPAALIGLGATHGTIEPGKAADLLLFTGDPLDPGSRLRLTLIDGRTAYAHD